MSPLISIIVIFRSVRRPIKDGAVLRARNLTSEPTNFQERSDFFSERGKASRKRVSSSDGHKDARRGEITPRVPLTSPTSATASLDVKNREKENDTAEAAEQDKFA